MMNAMGTSKDAGTGLGEASSYGQASSPPARVAEHAAIESLAEAWASIDGRMERFREGRDDRSLDVADGTYPGYMHEAEELLVRLKRRGYSLVPSNACPVDAALPGDPGLALPPAGPFLLVFAEAGVADEAFSGHYALECALARFAQVGQGYHCRLMAAVRSSIASDGPEGRLVSVRRTNLNPSDPEVAQ